MKIAIKIVMQLEKKKNEHSNKIKKKNEHSNANKENEHRNKQS